MVFDAEVDGPGGVASKSPGRNSAGFWIISGCGVPMLLYHAVPAKDKIDFLFIFKIFLYKVCYRISSVYLFFGLNAVCYIRNSHQISHRQCGFVSRLLPDSLNRSVVSVSFGCIVCCVSGRLRHLFIFIIVFFIFRLTIGSFPVLNNFELSV